MKYFVRIFPEYLYQGKSPEKAAEVLQTAVNVMRHVDGTGIVCFATAEKSGEYRFVGGVEKGEQNAKVS